MPPPIPAQKRNVPNAADTPRMAYVNQARGEGADLMKNNATRTAIGVVTREIIPPKKNHIESQTGCTIWVSAQLPVSR
jgi:hypothetical protein